MKRHWLGAIAIVAVLAIVAGVAAQASSSKTNGLTRNTAVSGSISFDGIWTASSRQTNFNNVIKALQQALSERPRQLQAGRQQPADGARDAVAGGHPPDMADIAQPGT